MAQTRGWRVREATAADVDVIVALFLEGDWHHHRGVPAAFAEPSPPVRSREHVENIINSERSAILLAEHEGEVAGFVHVEERSAPAGPVFVPQQFLLVDSIVVTESLRGSGAGQSLMEAAYAWGRTRSLASVQLNVWEFNAEAIRFYERLGYTTLSRRMSLPLPSTEME
jgi:ribosomal protein S18 acetylase RimI-like enzyme